MMNLLHRFFTVILTVMAFSGMAWAQDDIDYEQQNKAVRWYADRAERLLMQFEGIRHDSGQLPQKFYAFPSEKAGKLGFALAVATTDERQIVMFTPDGNGLKGTSVTRGELPENMYWNEIHELGKYITYSSDITLSQRPLPVRAMNKAKNYFEVVIDREDCADINPNEYNQMIFKPHQNSVRLVSKKAKVKKDEGGNVITDQMEFIFKLNNPAIVSKMFRGYKDEEAQPWVVKSSFFNTHHLLQYSRWKDGEPVVKASADTQRLISNYYGGRKITDTQWMATLESGERTFFAVQFEHQGKDALAAIVCLAEGEVVSTWEFHGNVDPATYKEGDSIWFVDDEGKFIPHAPEIECMVATDKGLEIYVRMFGGESVQYHILREVGPVWLTLQADYWIWVWD